MVMSVITRSKYPGLVRNNSNADLPITLSRVYPVSAVNP
jgi:hypothetical protein